jgi:S1-C subfamily serine protease
MKASDITRKGGINFMPAKSVQIHVLLIAFGFLAAVTPMTAGIYRGPEVTKADVDGGRPDSQLPAARSNIFGLTVSNIYDLGVFVVDLEIGSRAAETGIRKGDVILAVNDEPVLDTYQFHRLVYELVGMRVIFTVSRFGRIDRYIIDTR